MENLKDMAEELEKIGVQFDASGAMDLIGPQRSIEIERSDDTPYTNDQMLAMLESLDPVLDRTDLVGYVAARNARVLQDCAGEYIARIGALMEEYGRPETDGEGRPTGRVIVPYDDERFAEFDAKRREWAGIAHRPNLHILPIGEALGNLSGRQMLELDWMLGEERQGE